MPDGIFSDPRLAAVYDAFNPPGEDTAFYLRLAGTELKRILDVGCGTGHLACALAERGHAVTGLDPAAGMLAVARGRPGSNRVRWIQGDARSAVLGERFDLAIMTGHVFQVFLEDADVRAVLQTVRRHLAPGGRACLRNRNAPSANGRSGIRPRRGRGSGSTGSARWRSTTASSTSGIAS